MTGTAQEAAPEFWHIYKLPVIRIPTNKPCIRQELPERVFPDWETKWSSVVAEITRLHAQGRPVLVGTRNIAASETLAARLTELRLPFHLAEGIALLRGQRALVTGRGADVL